MDGVDLARSQLERDDPARAAVLADQQIQRVELIEEIDLMLDSLLVERLQDHVTSAICGITGALDRPFAEVPRVTPESALVHTPVRKAVEGQTHVLQLEHGIDRFPGQYRRGILVDQIVATLDGVEHVPLPVIFFDVA
jgi:hypothetical protein